MKKNTILGLLFGLLVTLFIYREFSPAVAKEIAFNRENEYINKYKNTAIDEMKIYKIPASITMAQALLESASGTSNIATSANNHFGIKCNGNWSGDTYKFTDNCYRKYATVLDSYRDHSVFITGASRYNFLFKLNLSNYKGWAEGLSKAGYATDPGYSKKLITMIELHNLSMLDI